MSILNKFVLEKLNRNKTGTAVTIVGIIISVAMVTAVLVFGTTFQNYLGDSSKEIDGDYVASIYNVTDKQMERLQQDTRIEKIGVLKSSEVKKIYFPKNKNYQKVQLIRGDKNLIDMLNIKILEGHYPKNNKEIMLPEDLFLNYNYVYKEGEQVNIDGKKYEVVGICENVYSNTSFEDEDYKVVVGGNAALDKEEIYISTNEINESKKIIKDNKINEGNVYYNEYLLSLYGEGDDSSFTKQLVFVELFTLFLIMLGAVVLMYNAFAISRREKLEDIKLLSSVGATKKQMRKTVFFEGLVLSVASIPVGILVGIGGVFISVRLLSEEVSSIISETEIIVPKIHVTLAVVIIATLISFVMVMISAFFSTIKSKTIDVARKKRKKKSLSKIKISKLGFEINLARKNFKRDRSRYRATTISLTISIVLFVLVSTVSTNLTNATNEFYYNGDEYDISYREDNYSGGEQSFASFEKRYDNLAQANGVIKSSVAEGIFGSTDKGGQKDEYVVNIVIIENSEFSQFIKANKLNKDSKVIAMKKGIVYNLGRDRFEVQKFLKNKKTELNIKVEEDCSYKVKIDAIANKRPQGVLGNGDGEMIVLSKSAAAEILPGYKEYLSWKVGVFKAEDNVKTYNAMMKICRSEGINRENITNDTWEYQQMKNMIVAINVFAYGFISLISLIAIANVFNTISANVYMRKKELAMLKSIGMSEKSLKKTMNYECFICGLKAIAFGIPLALFIVWAVIVYIDLVGLRFGYWIPWKSMAISVLGIFVIIFVTMSYARWKFARENIVDAFK